MKNILWGVLLLSTCSRGTDTTAQTSIMDVFDYRAFCLKAATDPQTFAIFRADPLYQESLEHVIFCQWGQVCLDVIKEQSPHFFNVMEKFKTSDLIGSPFVCNYAQVTDIAPTTVRYIKVASDLETLFGTLDGMSIVEIGGGYGGQCKILADLYSFKSYTIVDLEEPLALTRQFLSQCQVNNVTVATPEQYTPGQQYDLIISNYAFSECTMDVQKKYIEEIMKYAKRGYLTCNVIPQPHIKIPFQHELLQLLAQAHIPYSLLPEVPLTNRNNYVVVWGLKQRGE